ncbi:unnamed protein product [Rotaria sordida]|uniref:Uncharacterized protein n=1 Tax=Rotaria sordida TaxID=392033 RepID=A0A815HT71_9BILA|nr:unnamed protein product [Rotaria sordida]CAF1355915.1 unnamed protein product [Rotaria sordida]CAF4019001.1 unnamed protein product [Rotaria sordida]
MYFRPIRLFKLFIIVICIIIITYEIYRLLLRPRKKLSMIRNTDASSILLSKEGFEQHSYTLESFYISLPNFSDDEARNWFYSSSYYKINSKKCPQGSCEEKGVYFNDTKEHLSVNIFLIKNGLYVNDDCGYNYGNDAIQRTFKNSDEPTIIYDKAIIYTVPDGWSFQHFLDGIGPKLSHSKSYLQKYPDAKVIIIQGVRFDRSIKEIWSMLGLYLS